MTGRRKNGAGTIRKRKDGRWEGRVVVSYKENGDPVTKNVLAKTRTECQNKLNELIEKTLPPSKKLAPDMPFGVWIDFWYQNYTKPGVRESTRDAYENNIYNHIIPELGKIPLNQLSESDLQQFYSKMLKSGRVIRVEQYGECLSASIVRKMHVLCGAALEKAIESGFLRKNPNVGCKLPPKRGPMMQILSIEEMQRFLIQAKYDGLYELYLLELSTGLRLGELLALQWKDINFTTGALHVSKQLTTVHGKATISEPKTPASIRTVYLSKPVLEVLREYGKSVDSDWMFPSQRRNLPLHPSAIRKRLKGTLERAECKNVRFHDLRHTFATMALENGMDVKTLSEMLGHVSAATTLDVYSHVTDTMEKQAAIKIDRKFGKGDAPLPQEEKPKLMDQRNFQAVEGNRRRPGTGCLHQIGDHLWEGRYSRRDENGKRMAKNVYAKTKEECEVKLQGLIAEMKDQVRLEEKQKEQITLTM